VNRGGVLASPLVKRLLACLLGSLVLALMVGSQEGIQEDFGYAFRKAIFEPRVFVFLALGVLVFLLMTYWPTVLPYLTRPGILPLAVGVITVVAAQVLLHWDDQVGNAKFGAVANAVADTDGIAPIALAFFGWLAWTQLIVIAVLAAVSIARGISILGWIAAALSVIAAIIAFIAHHQVISFAGSVDHSLGVYAAILGYLVIALACVTAAMSNEQIAQTRAAFNVVTDWRPGLALVLIGLVATALALTSSSWFSPLRLNANLGDTRDLFLDTGLAPIAVQYLAWLGWTLFAVTAILGIAASYLRIVALGWAAALVGVVAVVLTLITLYDISDVGAQLKVDASTGPWQNLGSGGWLACLGLSLMAAGGFIAASTAWRSAKRALKTTPDAQSSDSVFGDRFRDKKNVSQSILLAGIAVALFFPPTMTQFWQTVLVSEIGVYVLLAIGLNVVVGWAGLLDLGFIAFYAIGSYTTAYLVGSLPVKPPSWLHMTPLLTIPFAILVCLLAGLALGAPTLRLRGDYLAIVTLGFGEIIRITAINNPGNFTNSTRGPTPAVPHPSIHIGPIHIQWGLNNLQYWYLLLVLIIIVVVLFYRLEGSRLGRAWAAIREDEVAAQATGINTTRVKLMAFAIGASTSGLAGVFFASQVGFFTPDNFVLNNSILVVAYVVFGGMGSLQGAIAGAAVLTWLPEFLKDQVPADDRQMWIGAVVLLMMNFRPAGLIPAKRRKAELSGLGAPLSSETRAVAASEGL
jgi:ABC-type branched-subunit amino acid transport system permease subunit